MTIRTRHDVWLSLFVVILACCCVSGQSVSSVVSYNITTVAGGGNSVGDGLPAVNALLNSVRDVAYYSGVIVIADTLNNRIRKISNNGIISTIAGNGQAGYNGDGIDATKATVNSPHGVAFHPTSGEVYFADYANHRIRKIYSNGTITTIAGNGEPNYNGDNIPATSAQLGYPIGIAVSSGGEVFIADTLNNRIRKISNNGMITTIAGNGTGGYSGDGGPAVNAMLNTPFGVAIDSDGNIVFADLVNNRIRKVYSSGTIVTIVGTGEAANSPDGSLANNAPIRFPLSVALTKSNDLYFSDSYQRIRKVSATSGIISSIAGDGQSGYNYDGIDATIATLNNPVGIAIDSSNNEFYIADSNNNRIRKVSSSGKITTIAGGTSSFGNNVPAIPAFISPIGSMSLNNNQLSFADSSGQFRQINLTSNLITTLAGTVGYTTIIQTYSNPNSIKFFNNDMYVMYTSNSVSYIDRIVNLNYGPAVKLAGAIFYNGDNIPATSAIMNYPSHCVINSTNGELIISDMNNHRIRKVSNNGIITTIAGNGTAGFCGDGGLAVNTCLNRPNGIAISSSGELYIADYGNHRIRKVSNNGIITTIAGNGNTIYNGDGIDAANASLYSPVDVSIGANNEIYIADAGNYRIRKIFTNGTIVTIAGTGTNGFSGDNGLGSNATIGYPSSVLFNSGNVYFTDIVYCVIRKIYSNGTITTISGKAGTCTYGGDGGKASNAQLSYPAGIAISSTGDIYISDNYNHRIRVISSVTGIISNIAGTGRSEYNGDGLHESITNFAYPVGLTFDSSENLIVCETTSSWKIRKILATTGMVSTIAGGIGDGLNASNAFLVSTLFDISNSGEIYIADTGNHRIRKIFTNGTIITIAGNGIGGYAGDGGQATSAQLNNPKDVAVSSNGELIIADYSNNRIRKVFTNGTITTIAGTGTNGYGGDNGLATTAKLSLPVGVSISSGGEIYISETNRIRKVLTNGTIYTIAGTLSNGYKGDNGLASLASLNAPGTVSIGPSGELYFADTENSVIRKLTPYCNAYSSICERPFSILGLPSYYIAKSDLVNFDLIISKLSVDQTIIDSLKLTSSVVTFTVQISNSAKTFTGISIQNTQSGILTLFPTISISNQISVNFTSLTFGFSSTATASLQIDSVSLYSSFELQFRIPPKSPNNLLNSNSTKCSAIKEIVNLNINPWSADSMLLPLKYAITFSSSKLSSIRITDFSQDLNRSIVLPNVGETISLGIIVMDSLGNYYSKSSSLSILVAFFNGTMEEYSKISSNSGTNFNLITSLIYDVSFSSSTTYYASLLSNIDVSGSDPSSALSSLSEIISKTQLDETIANTTLSKLSELVSYSYNRYNTSKSSYGYVNSKISNSNVNSILSYASQFLGAELLLSNSRELAQNLADLIILGQLVTYVDTNDGSLVVSSYSSSNINMTISAFVISSASTQLVNQKVEQDQTSVSFNASYIISQNVAYSSECAVSLLTYSNLFNNSYSNNNGTSEGISITTDFKFLKNQKVVKLENLANPIIIEFKLTDQNILEKLQNSSNYNFTCTYLEESSGTWSDEGCYLYSFNLETRIVQCACNHTTLFTTFLEQKTIPLSDNTKRQVASLYYGQISLGIFYFIISITVLILMIIFRKSQPLISRLSTPYLGMIALMVESLLIYIIQRSVLVDQLFKDSTNWSSGDLAANWIANIVMIFVNTLNLTAILAYLIQVLRFQLMKYLYNILHQLRKSQSNISQSSLLKNLKRFTSKKVVNSILLTFVILNLLYWTLWVILRRCDVISLTAYTYIISISYIIIIFALSLVISGTAVVDFIYSMIKQHSSNKKSIEETKKTKVDLQIVKEKISSMGIHKWLISMDTPLYFRGEMLLYIVFFILLIVNQSLGMSTLPFRYDNEQSYRNVLTNDVIAFIFEVVYVAVYILVFGGYSLLIIISNKIRFKLRKVPETLVSDQEENREMLELIGNSYGREIFEAFCRKEFSVENLYLFLDLQEKEKLDSNNANDINNFIERIYNTYIKNGSEMEVNIPSSCSKEFKKLLQVSNNQESEMVDLKQNNPMKEQADECFLNLRDNVIMNLSDTFSRFVLTSEYEFFSQVFDFSQNNLGKSLKIGI
ncbi:predicted protein [Naegleria gruberi]|uniref:Predicted protein n=1 Tax=Naegleria gruberi TaxID=5762 RepID=D2VFB9_NAEGR|nr:uncharacterized protein NAEGRDRAFT_67572 [Naegleria gruberi]EFC44432.1 predicted protein [Naegleria gruberi]|eukprot:XP_002677176.1 predicted protein [Naegleria gruberi strain NEG-M]